jgi:hypothetical protein
MIGKIKRVPLREVWKHEALDFTAWLQKNIDVVGDVVNVPLDEAEREQSAGNFSVDLVATDSSGDPVVIENQLEKSNHDHLGKLLTYLVAFEAKTAIWIVSEPRPEHVSTITWLNESSSASFYLLKVEAIKIDDSPPAPLLTLVVGPSYEGREVGKKKKELAQQDATLLRFWTAILDRAREQTLLHASIPPKRSNWLIDTAGIDGLTYGYVVSKNNARVELYIDRGRGAAENKAIFDALVADREAIEAAFGEPLDWQRRDDASVSKIQKQIDVGGYADESRWDRVQEALIEAMIRLDRAFSPHISNLKV